ncbi:MAG: hypothetical protein LC729_04700 [Acidobacteria bacterium]|nr:hypothetical protein [Acidobacteriota bacterium]
MCQHPQLPDGLLTLIQQAREHYLELPRERKRGKPRTYSGLSFLLLAVVAVTLRTFKASELHRLLLRDEALRRALEFDPVPHRTTLERRLKKLLPEMEAQVAAIGQQLVKEVEPDATAPQTSAIDGRMYEAQGPKWHTNQRREGRIPIGLRNVDTESHWFKSGYRGWVQGYRLVLQALVFPSPVPLFATWQSNAVGEATIMAHAMRSKRLPVTAVLLGDTSFGSKSLRRAYARQGGWVLTPTELPKERRSWKHDLYAYRKESIELLFQRVIQACDLKSCPSKGLNRNGAFVIASVWLYQIIFLCNYRAGRPVAHIKEQLDLARWRIAA